MLKLNDIRETQSARIAILDPETHQDTGAWIEVASPEHPKAKAIQFAEERRMRKRVEKEGRLTFEDPEKDAERFIDLLVACTLDWGGFANDDGSPMECSAENVRAAYIGTPWLRKQVDVARRDTANFIQRCNVTSSPSLAPRSGS